MAEYPFITYDQTTNIYYVDPGAATKDLEYTIRDASDGATVILKAGTHVFTETLDIKQENISIVGEGENLTTIVIDNPNDREGIKINAGSSGIEQLGTLAASVTQHSKTVTLQDGHNVQAGDVLRISQENDPDWFLSYGPNDEVYANRLEYVQSSPLREGLMEVESVDGNVITLKHSVPYDMDGGGATVEKMNLLDNIRLADFKVTYNLGEPDPDAIDNVLPDYHKHTAIQALSTNNLVIENVTVEDAASHAIELRRALEPHINEFTADGAHNKGGSKNGYGLHIGETFYGTFENLEFYDLRHGFILSSWHAEAYNDVHIRYMNRDLNFHGSPDHSNTFVIDTSIYNDGSSSWSTIGLYSARVHPYSDPYLNDISFRYAEGSVRDDILHAHDDGAYLNGKAGNDTLFGGAGIDTFLFRIGEGDDTINSFEAHQDIILLDGENLPDRLEDLDMIQNGDHVVITLDSDSILTIHNTHLADLNTNNLRLPGAIVNTPPVMPTDDNEQDWIDYLNATITFDKTLNGTDNADRLFGLNEIDLIFGGNNNDFVRGNDGNDSIFGQGGNDHLRGDNGNDFIHGGAGLDLLKGGAGNDLIFGEADNDRLLGESGDDILYGGTGNDLLRGGTGNDTLFGDDGKDRLMGEAGNDVLHGGGDADRLYGGTGNDTFVFDDLPEIADVLHDYNTGGDQDTLDLSAFFNGLGLTAQQVADEGYINLYDHRGHSYLQVDQDGSIGTQHDLTLIVKINNTLSTDIDLSTIIV